MAYKNLVKIKNSELFQDGMGRGYNTQFPNQYLFQDVSMICPLSPLTAIVLTWDLFQKNKSWPIVKDGPFYKFQQLNSELSHMKHTQEADQSDFHCL